MADAVGQDEEILRRVEELAGPEEDPGEVLREEGLARPGRAVQEEDRVRGGSLAVFPESADRPVVNPDLRQRLSGRELEIAQDEVARDRVRVRGGGEQGYAAEQDGEKGERGSLHRPILNEEG